MFKKTFKLKKRKKSNMRSHTYGNYKKKLNLENSLKIFLDRLLFLNSQTSIYFGTFILRERDKKSM